MKLDKKAGIRHWPRISLQFKIGLGLLVLLLLTALIGLLVGNFSIESRLESTLVPACPQFPLGTDALGRDLFSCIIYGTVISVVIGLMVSLLSAAIGTLMGLTAALAGGLTDQIISRSMDLVLAFPGIVLAIALAAFSQHNMTGLMCILVIGRWAAYARLIRGEALKYKQKEFILAARSYNASFSHILYHHLFPIIRSLLLVQISIGFPSVILVESALNFLGIGLSPEIPTLGQLIDMGRVHLFTHPLLAVAPGTVLSLVIITFNFIAEGVREKMTH